MTSSDPQGYDRKRDQLLTLLNTFTVNRAASGAPARAREDMEKQLAPFVSSSALASIPTPPSSTA
eukprot:5181736-Pyramimonas_sp.AAC.1